MKNLKKMVSSALVLTVFFTNANAQATATAVASATVVTPISITKDEDLDFGNISVQASTGGTVILTPAGTRTRTGGVTLPAIAGNVTSAVFVVTGSGTYTYAITLPTTVILTRTSGTETMTASSFTSTPSGTGALTAGSQEITVGATLTVAAGQAAGVYTSGTPFGVTVNYN